MFDEVRQAALPDGSDAAQLNSLKTSAIMAHLLTASAGKYRARESPKAEVIGSAVDDAAKRFFGEDVRGYVLFHKTPGAEDFRAGNAAATAGFLTSGNFGGRGRRPRQDRRHRSRPSPQ